MPRAAVLVPAPDAAAAVCAAAERAVHCWGKSISALSDMKNAAAKHSVLFAWLCV